jgi:hypothetical protein
MRWLISNPHAFRFSLAQAAVALALSVCCAAAPADETVQVCGSSYGNNVFVAGPAASIGATSRCPTPGSSGGLELFAEGDGIRGETARWQAIAPSGLELVGATANGTDSQGVNAGLDYGGGFYWASGGTEVNPFTPTNFGMIFSRPSNHFGMQLICGRNRCTSAADFRVPAFSLYVRETGAPSFAAPIGLWQTRGWIRGRWQVFAWGNSPAGLCWLSATLDGQPISTTTSMRDVSTWHQCAAPPINQSLDTSRFGQRAVPLTLATVDAANVPARISKSVYIDNSTPIVALSGPTDVPSTAGTQYVTATAGGSPSGIADVVCTLDGGAAQTSPGASAQIAVSGIGEHSVSCYSENNAVDPAGAHGRSGTATWSLKIGQPTELGIDFHKLVGLRCRRARVRVTIPARWITVHRHHKLVKIRTRGRHKVERVKRCRPRTERRRIVVFVRRRRHGRIIKVKRIKYVYVVVPPHLVVKTARVVAFGHRSTVYGWLGTSTGTALSGQAVRVLTAPNNGSGMFTEAATVTTAVSGNWKAELPPGPSRIVEAVFDGSPTTEATSSDQVHLVVPAQVRMAIRPRTVPWGASIRIFGRVLGGYVPTNSKLLRLNVGIGRIGHIEGLPNIRRSGRFVIVWRFNPGRGVLHPWFSVGTLSEAAFPYAPGTSKRVAVTLGEPTPRRRPRGQAAPRRHERHLRHHKAKR